ncbi:VanZ family protein [Neobacillus sp. CF12]|uniref:VanZ family protein n=1 Tax=Neobacillus sp. CF12 TaxID=3055864 RepID=UPI0025A2E100|nr:VanZ family protein [Neobacillus sp. CF12]MDM5326559.1 VanZ family protein [Neobacillus sp. CF12]
MKKLLLLTLIISIFIFLLLSPVLLQLVSYLHPVVLGVVFFCIVMSVLFFICLIRRETIQISYSNLRFLLLFYSFGLFILLFFRHSDQSYQSLNLIPLSTIAFYLSGKVNGLIVFYNLAANIGLFIPYGIFLMVKNRSRFQLFYLPFLFISMIEILQYVSHRGSMDIDDLILNVLGFYIGYLLHPLFNKVIKVLNKN